MSGSRNIIEKLGLNNECGIVEKLVEIVKKRRRYEYENPNPPPMIKPYRPFNNSDEDERDLFNLYEQCKKNTLSK